MPSQIFKNDIPIIFLRNFLEKNSMIENGAFIFNNIAFKKSIYNSSLTEFIEICKPFYHISKQYYLNREMTYSKFTTVLRQYCKFKKISYNSTIKYDKSKYDICYYITLPICC